MSDCAASCGLIHDWERTMARFQHDARTPLNIILGFAQLLEMDTLTDDQRECVTAIGAAGGELLRLLETLGAPEGEGSPRIVVRAAGLEPARHEASEF